MRAVKPGLGRALLGCAVLWAALLAAACGSKKPVEKSSPSAPGTELDDGRVVLRVGAGSYSAADFSRYVRETVGGSVQELDATALSNLFDQFVNDKILLQDAAAHGITLSAEEIKANLEKAEPGTWTEEEKASLLTSDSGPLIDKMRIQKYIQELNRDVAVTDEEIRAYYDSHPGEFSLAERVQVSQILVPTEHEAVELWEKIRFADEDSFRAAARSESVGPEASSGGEMGVFERGQLPAEMETAVFGMQEGEVSSVVESSYGYHIFRLDRKLAPETVPFENAVPSVKRKLLERKSEATASRRIEELKKSLDWDIFTESLFFPYQREDT